MKRTNIFSILIAMLAFIASPFIASASNGAVNENDIFSVLFGTGAIAVGAVQAGRGRSSFDMVKGYIANTFKNKGIQTPVSSLVVSPDYIEMMTIVANGKNTYQFYPVAGTNSSNATTIEKRVATNNVFFANRVGMYLSKSLNAIYGNHVKQTYPNPGYFATGGATFVPADLETFYNGSLSFKVGTVVYTEGLDTHRFRAVPTAQQGAITAAIAGPVTYDLDNSGFEQPMGSSPLDPFWIVSGAESSTIDLNIPPDSTTAVANNIASTTNIVIIKLWGFTAYQVANQISAKG